VDVERPWSKSHKKRFQKSLGGSARRSTLEMARGVSATELPLGAVLISRLSRSKGKGERKFTGQSQMFPPVASVLTHRQGPTGRVDPNAVTESKGNIMAAITLLPLETVLAMKADELDALILQAARLDTRQKSVTTDHKASFSAVGILICGLEVRLNALKAEGKIGSATSVAAYWKSITKTDINNHAQSCAGAYSAFVTTGNVTAKNYGLCTGQCLQLGNTISCEVGGDVENPFFKRAAVELNEHGKDSLANLRKILEEVKPGELSPKKAGEMYQRLIKHGYGLLGLSMIGAEVAHLADPQIAKQTLFAIELANDMFTVNKDEDGERRFSEETLSQWLTEYRSHGKQPALNTEELEEVEG
jgi:hypothetical protein